MKTTLDERDEYSFNMGGAFLMNLWILVAATQNQKIPGSADCQLRVVHRLNQVSAGE